ncbi:MAG: hypothetical protein C4B58_01435 [Deltaproteobacteria bacterium]|uniref:Uncharacterized protein n=1 Tax=Candidatus Methanogaster sp. TaxID=3386292 RepID=A0AC61KZY9_9EURY|nr:MAG: hypothetical protein C4B59_14035 [ANME-2 cluster archaeon]PXF60180.1 MAG: hypothetical protein C4B58_01435 [Deltaproteobacteria bacterium]
MIMNRASFIILTAFLILIFVSTALASTPKKIFCVQSYDKGNVCGARIEDGMLKSLKKLGYEDGKNIELFHFYMDTRLEYIKPEEVKMRGKLALNEIKKVDPDLVLIFDDNACEYVMLPLAKSKYPIVFSGMNVRPEYYDNITDFMKTREYPSFNITGVTEEVPYEATIKLLKELVPDAKKMVAISSTGAPFPTLMARDFEQKITAHPEKYPIKLDKMEYIRTFKEYKSLIEKYEKAEDIDIIFNVIITTLEDEKGKGVPLREALGWMVRNQNKPGFTWLADWVPMGYLCSAGIDLPMCGEQVAQQVVQILNGKKPGDIPIERPKDQYVVLNLARAEQLGITIPVSILEAAAKVYRSMSVYPEYQMTGH